MGKQTSSAIPASNPCLTCGACCAHFRVSFYWSEAEVLGIPESMTEQINPWFSCMSGTAHQPCRCQALDGEIGGHVGCTLYLQRPSPCHELQAGDKKCNQARMAHGLPPIILEDERIPMIVIESPSEPVFVVDAPTSKAPLEQHEHH